MKYLKQVKKVRGYQGLEVECKGLFVKGHGDFICGDEKNLKINSRELYHIMNTINVIESLI